MDNTEYHKNAHAMQAGVAMDIETGSKTAEPKHLRTGINAAMADQAGLVALLIEKGVFTEEEYVDAITRSMHQEKDRHEKSLSEKLGSKITLI